MIAERDHVVADEIFIDERVRKMDPLGLDEFLIADLPRLNRQANSNAIKRFISEFTTNPDSLVRLNREESLAATRDLGMVAASLVRHGVDLQTQFPALPNSLLILAQKTLEVPRDTVFSYGPRNPQDERIRTFTGEAQERTFIEGFTQGMRLLPECIRSLVQASNLPVNSEEFRMAVAHAKNTFRNMVEGMVRVKRNVDPSFFYKVLRPYFPPMNIDGKVYMAPGGAQMPVLLIDQLFWAKGESDRSYRLYFEDNIKYLPPEMRELAQTQSVGSLLDNVLENLSVGVFPKSQGAGVISSIDEMLSFFSEIQKFRALHKKGADQSFSTLRPEDARGSGGYSNLILADLLQLTIKAKRRLSEAKKDFVPSE